MHYLCGFETNRGNTGAVVVFAGSKFDVENQFRGRMNEHLNFLHSDPPYFKPATYRMTWWVPESAVRRIRAYEN